MDRQVGYLAMDMNDFELTFAPVHPPPDDTWIQVFLDLVGLGATVVKADAAYAHPHPSLVTPENEAR
jgi:hypothetical protein